MKELSIEEKAKEDSRIKNRVLIVRKLNSKMRYYEDELAKSEDGVKCDGVDWIKLCSDMFSLLEAVRSELFVNPTLFETPESIEEINCEIQDAALDYSNVIEFVNSFIKGAWWALKHYNLKKQN